MITGSVRRRRRAASRRSQRRRERRLRDPEYLTRGARYPYDYIQKELQKILAEAVDLPLEQQHLLLCDILDLALVGED